MIRIEVGTQLPWAHHARASGLLAPPFERRRSQEHVWGLFASYAVVASPMGMGLDCHRTWDVLAVGAIPVVLRHGPAFDAVFDGQPVLLVRSWAEVCVGNATNASLLDGALRRFHSVGAQLDPRRRRSPAPARRRGPLLPGTDPFACVSWVPVSERYT